MKNYILVTGGRFHWVKFNKISFKKDEVKDFKFRQLFHWFKKKSY